MQTIKRVSVLLLIFSIFILSGYSSCTIDDDEMIKWGAKLVSTEIGCEAAKLDPDVDFILRNLYTLATTGQLTPDLMNRLIDEISDKVDRPTLVLSLIDLVEMLGAGIGDDGQTITDVANINEDFLLAISEGYVRGYEICLD